MMSSASFVRSSAGSGEQIIHEAFTLPRPDTGEARERASEFFNMVHLEFCGEFAVTGFVHRLEGGALLIEVEVGLAGGAVSMLFNEDFRDVWPIALGVTLVLAVNEHHNVRILLNAPRIAQVAQAGLAAALSLPRARAVRAR